MPVFPVYCHATVAIPEENIAEGDIVAIDPRDPHPITSLRFHGTNIGRFLGYQADGKLERVDGIIGLPRQFASETSPPSPGQAALPQSG
jgi:hypothetical protein